MIDSKKDAYLFGLAKAAAEGSTCPRAKVGCVLVRPSSFTAISLGYNGAPRGLHHCTEVGCRLELQGPEENGIGLALDYSLKELSERADFQRVAQYHGFRIGCSRAEHAERNALYNAARQGLTVEGSYAYVTHRPCWQCARALWQAGVLGAVYETDYPGVEPEMLIELAKVGFVMRRGGGV